MVSVVGLSTLHLIVLGAVASLPKKFVGEVQVPARLDTTSLSSLKP